MARRIDEVIAGLPKARRERVEAKAARLVQDMIGHADSLGDLGGGTDAAAKQRRTSGARAAARRTLRRRAPA